MENFEAQRAAITAELTQAALTGGDTAKAREKLARLDERERAAQEAAQGRQRCGAYEPSIYPRCRRGSLGEFRHAVRNWHGAIHQRQQSWPALCSGPQW